MAPKRFKFLSGFNPSTCVLSRAYLFRGRRSSLILSLTQDTDQDGVITRQEFHTVMEREALATKLSLNEGTLEEQILEIQQAVDRTVFSLCQQLEGLWGGSID